MTGDRRVIGVLAHVDAGKTTLSEQLLHAAGEIRRPGAVERGNTVTDWLEDEQERGITITSAAAGFSWRGVAVDLVDTPGHVDFSVEVERVLRVLDGAILVISAPAGVQAQTEAIWRALRQERVPTLLVVNKLDQPHPDLAEVLARASERLEVPLLPIQWPSYEDTEDAFVWYGHWDVLSSAWHGVDGDGATEAPVASPAPDPEGAAWQDALVEHLAECDDRVMIQYLEAGSVEPELLSAALREAAATHRALPVVFTVASEGLGIEALLDAALAWLPSPPESRPRLVFDGQGQGRELARARESELLAMVFKTEAREALVVIHVRVFEGELRAGALLGVAGQPGLLRCDRVARLLGREIIDVEVLPAGAVGAIIVPASTPLLPDTGATLGLDTSPPVAFERPQLLLPVVWATFEAAEADAHPALEAALRAHVRDDPSLALAHDLGTGQLLVGGRGELHLEVLHRRLGRTLGGGDRVRIGRPVVRRRGQVDAISRGHGRAASADGQGSVVAEVEIAPTSEAVPIVYRFEVSLPPEIEGVIREAIASGVHQVLVDFAGADLDLDFPAIAFDLRADGPSALSPIVYREAALRGLRDALGSGQIEIRVPFVDFEATVPHDSVGRFHAELARRGLTVAAPTDTFGAYQLFKGEAPLSPLLGFAAAFRTITNGRGHWAVRPAGLRPEPGRETNMESA